MKKFIIAASVIFLAACSSAGQEVQTPQPGPSTQHVEVRTAGSIAFPCVKWNDRIYQITKTQVTDVGEQIGEITLQSLEPIADTPNNFSTTFSEGSKLYAINDIPTAEAIAVLNSEGEYIKVEVPVRE